ncbi:hypothetical protein MHU86_7086 [Fragilaria crotonensis]|nr:hypothetical protein MHU86_7086 [Fragilaria crotonensis]
MRAAMTRLGFTEAAAQALVDEQGMDSLEEIRLLTDDEIASLCAVIRRPGGMIPAPPGGVAGGAANIPNPGVPVNQRAEGHLKLLAFYLRHQMRTMEAIDEYLRSVLGERMIPLAYVVRKEEAIPDDDANATYPTIQDEMIARAPHYTLNAENVRVPDPVYLANRGRVWDIISQITREHPCWTYVKPAQKTRDGRMAYHGLYLHYLGPNNIDNMATMAEQKLKDTVYNGEQRRWDFEKYINVHKQQHSVMEGLVEHGYTGIDPRSKVRYLLDGIKTDKFDAVKTRIMSDERLRNDFDACVTLYQDYIRQTSKGKSNSPTVNISELKTGKCKANAIEDRYYTKDEYAKLTPEQKKEPASKRLKRGHKPGAKDSKTKSGGKPKDVIKNLRAVNRQVSQLAKQMSKATVDEQGTVSSSSDSSLATQKPPKKAKVGTNRSNAALSRQKKASTAESQ